MLLLPLGHELCGCQSGIALVWLYHLRGDRLKALHYFVGSTLGEIIPLDFGRFVKRLARALPGIRALV